MLTECGDWYVPFGILFDPKRSKDMALPPYFKARLARIYKREVHRVQVFDFGGLPDLMADGLSARMLMEHRDAQGVSLFTSRAWKQLFDIRGPLIGISSAGDFLGTSPSYTTIRDSILRLCHRLIACSIVGRSQAPKKVIVTDLFYLRGMDVGSVNVPYLLARYLRLFAAGRKSRDFISRVRLQICMEIDDTWAWVAQGPERLPDAAAGTHGAAEVALAVDDDMPQAVPPPPRTQESSLVLIQGRSEQSHVSILLLQVLENQLLSVSLLICLRKRDCVERIPSADGNLRELSGEEAWETIENFAQGQKEWDNPLNIISEQEIENLKVHVKRLFGNEKVWVKMHRNIA
ncbi:hypothetical protein Tco_1343345 [Tanacetum coccineum]